MTIAKRLGCGSAAAIRHRFPDGESSLRIDASLAGRDVGIVCTLDHPDDKLAALLFAAELARDLGAFSVGLLAPYLAYMRQDIRFHPGESVTARYFARTLSAPDAGWLRSCTPVIIDDIASTGGTLRAAIRAIIAAGGAQPVCIVVHPIFVDAASADLQAAGAARIVSCDTVAHASNAISIESALAVAVSGMLQAMVLRRLVMPAT